MHPLTLRQLAAEHIQALIAGACQERAGASGTRRPAARTARAAEAIRPTARSAARVPAADRGHRGEPGTFMPTARRSMTGQGPKDRAAGNVEGCQP